MSKRSFKVWILSTLLGGLVCLGSTKHSVAEVNINIGTPGLNISIGTPLPVVVHSPPPMVVIPGTYVYIVPDIHVDILFYRGHWYRPHNGHWFRASSYNGPWVHAAPSRIPRAVLQLPPSYRRITTGQQGIPYKEIQGNWERWEREKRWHKNESWHGGYRGDRKKFERDQRGYGKHGKRGRD